LADRVDELERALVLAELKIAELTVRLKTARDDVRRLRGRVVSSRVPVVLEVEPSGDVTLYAGHGTVDLAIVEWPRCGWNATVEEWLTWQLAERQRDVYLPSCVEARVNGAKIARLLTTAYAEYERMLVDLPAVRSLVEQSKKERAAFASKGKAKT